MSEKRHRFAWVPSLLILLPALALVQFQPTFAQETSRTFPETGKTVGGKFLDYWDSHGGLAQQGYPISSELQERSEIDGKVYTMQYFERAVFELHPENSAPYDVLLSLLGVMRYKDLYPDGASGQQPNTSAGSVLFNETGKRLGGKFLDYWQANGGLAQQGYPISDEFTEKSALDGKPYLVQYFERAVFELHPENSAPYDVLLLQLGTFYPGDFRGTPTPTATPTATPPPPTLTVDACVDIPPAKDATITPNCGTVHTTFKVTITGFQRKEMIISWMYMPNGACAGSPRPVGYPDDNGTLTEEFPGSVLPGITSDYEGIWSIWYEGEESQHRSAAWFKIVK